MAAGGVCGADAGAQGGVVGGGARHPGVVPRGGGLALLADIPHQLGLAPCHYDDTKWTRSVEFRSVQKTLWLVT